MFSKSWSCHWWHLYLWDLVSCSCCYGLESTSSRKSWR